MSAVDLRDYQLAAVAALRDGIRVGHRKQVLMSPTGSGKTEIASYMLDEARAKTSASVSAEASRDALAVAYANNEAAQATLAHQAGAATLSANLRAQRIASVEAAVAQRELAQAQANYDAAIASGSVRSA